MVSCRQLGADVVVGLLSFGCSACGARSQLLEPQLDRDAAVADADVGRADAGVGADHAGDTGPLPPPSLNCTTRCEDGRCPAVDIACGEGATCAVLADGTVRCWGDNTYGELGDGTTVSRSTPRRVPGITAAVQIVSAINSVCAILANGTVQCWGSEALLFGAQPQTPLLVPGASGVSQVALSSALALARLNDGSTMRWGDWWSIQDGEYNTPPSLVPGLINVADIAVGTGHACARFTDATLYCWGENFYGQVGGPPGTPVTMPDRQFVAIPPVLQVAAGELHTCALTVDHQVYCWGYNGLGQLGDGTNTDRNEPTRVLGVADAVQISLGDYDSCATLADGTASCWGDNDGGQLGNNRVDAASDAGTTPQRVTGLTNVVKVSMGFGHACALRSDCSVVCWGDNLDGALGDGTTVSHATPVPVAW